MNPMDDIVATRNLARTSGDNNADICFLALADNDCRASVRTLVLRDIKGRELSVFINETSPKWKLLSAGCHWELLLWYPSQQKQFRLSGKQRPLDKAEVHRNWFNRPEGSKWLDLVYENITPQTSLIDSRQSLIDIISQVKTRFDLEKTEPPSSVSGVKLEADRIEILNLSNEDRIHDRRVYQWVQGSWEESFLIP